MAADDGRTLTEWVVLGVLAEEPAHGFAVAKLLERGGPVGRVWAATRPLVYRALDRLHSDGLILPVRDEPGLGPRRVVFGLTADGSIALDQWLRTPVPRLRDVRAELLVKLLLLERAGRSSRRLLTAQRRAFGPLVAAALHPGAEGVVGRWRHHQAEAVARFLEIEP